MTQFIVLKAELWPSMTLVFVNSIYKELYIVHETSGKITLLSFLIRFMLNFFLFIPLFSDLTIPSGSWYILRYTVNNKSRILLQVCSVCRICLFLLPFTPHSVPSTPKQISYSIIIGFLYCVFNATPFVLV